MHFGPTLAVHQAAAQIPGLFPGLLSLCHNALHLHKLGLADDLRQGVFYQDFGSSAEAKIMKTLMWSLSEYYLDNLSSETKKGHQYRAYMTAFFMAHLLLPVDFCRWLCYAEIRKGLPFSVAIR